jgi:hypothetical protein
MSRDTHTMSLRLNEEEHEALRGAAYAFGTSMNEVVRRAIREFLTGPARREEIERLFDRANQEYGAAFRKLADL